MDIVDKLNRKLLKQDFIPRGKAAYQEELEMYKGIARGYAVMENAVAVLSDMRSDFSYIYYGGFAGRWDWPAAFLLSRWIPSGKRISSA